MTSLKRKIALNLSIAFSLLFGIVMTTIYISFNSFRREEFKDRFVKRLDFTTNFISQSDGFNKQASVAFSENADNILFDENIIIFDAQKSIFGIDFHNQRFRRCREIMFNAIF